MLPDRLAAVLAVVYLIFTRATAAAAELAAEAIRLGRALAELMPDEPEVHGLLALMLLNDSRRAARFADGELVLLAEQDRGLWDGARSWRGRAAVDRALALLGRRHLRPAGGNDGAARRRADGLAAGRRALRRSSPASPARRWSSSTAPSRSPRRAIRGRARPRLRARARRLPLPALDARGGAAAPRAGRRGGRRHRRALALTSAEAERRLLERRLAGVEG